MALGIIIGYFVPETGPTLQRGEFVNVSIPIGTSPPTTSPILPLTSPFSLQPSVSS